MILVVVTILGTAVKMAVDARRAARGDPPRAVHVYVPPAAEPIVDGSIILVMVRSRHFGVNIFVTVYYEESLGAGQSEIFERSIGIGRVVNIQENGLIQVRVLREVSNHSDLWQRIRNHEMANLSHVVIKPSMSEVKGKSQLAKIVHVVDPNHARGPLEVVINQGSLQGVKPGDQFVVFGIGPHIQDPDTGEDLGALEVLRGRGEVVHVQEHLATVRTIERQRTRPAKRITREPGWGAGRGLTAAMLGTVIEEELSPEMEIPFEAVQLGDLAKPV